MKRWILAAAFLFPSAGLVSADYVIIIANVGASKDKELKTQPGMGMRGGQMPGMLPGGGNRGGPQGPMPGMGGNRGGPQGPMPGMGGNRGGPQGPMPGMGGNRGGPQGPMPGMGGPQGSMPGMGGMQGMGNRGGPMPGMGGMQGGMMGGGMQGGGMRGGMMGMRGGSMGMMGGGRRGMGGPTDVEDVPDFIIAVVEVKPTNTNTNLHKLLTNPKKIAEDRKASVTHQWGGSTLLAKTSFAETIVLTQDSDHKPLPKIIDQFNVKFAETFKSKPSAEVILELAEWTLRHGLVDKFPQVMNKLIETDKSHPAAIAYGKVQADLAKPVKDETLAWRDRLLHGYKADEKPGQHYTLLHSQAERDQREVDSHLDLLEQSFRGFYYWFALHKIALPVPDHRLAAVMTGATRSKDFDRLSKILTSGPVVVDGFFARRENLSVMASKRQDEPYDALKKFWARWEAKDFRATEILGTKNGKAGAPRGTQPDQIHEAQMVALMLKALEREAELATITHDAGRQLLFASGLLPRNVAAPEWLMFGMGSFFETPLRSPWASIGAPSTYYLPLWQELKAKGMKAGDGTLVKVVTDAYFRTLPPQGEAGTEAHHAYDAALRKARATSWSLTYYLAHQKLDGLQRYFQELSKMPRDLELDEGVLLDCFARAFGAVDRNNKVDQAALRALESKWFLHMGNEKFASETTMKKIRKIFQKKLDEMEAARNQSNDNGGQGQIDPRTGRPMQPGGFGPGMGPQGPGGRGGFQPPGVLPGNRQPGR